MSLPCSSLISFSRTASKTKQLLISSIVFADKGCCIPGGGVVSRATEDSTLRSVISMRCSCVNSSLFIFDIQTVGLCRYNSLPKYQRPKALNEPPQRLSMPYYIFNMSSQEGMELVKNLELIAEFDSFKEAKAFARERRSGLDDEARASIKMIFAENQLLAEEQLLEHRDKPVTMEHEK